MLRHVGPIRPLVYSNQRHDDQSDYYGKYNPFKLLVMHFQFFMQTDGVWVANPKAFFGRT